MSDLTSQLERILADHPVSYETAADPDRPRAVCDGGECDWREPDEFEFMEAEEAHQHHVARQLTLKIIADQLNTANVIEVHHHDIEDHAASFNEGYEAAVAQHLADDPTTAQDWLDARLTKAARAALAEAADVMPIDTLLGADKASVWLRARAEGLGK